MRRFGGLICITINNIVKPYNTVPYEHRHSLGLIRNSWAFHHPIHHLYNVCDWILPLRIFLCPRIGMSGINYNPIQVLTNVQNIIVVEYRNPSKSEKGNFIGDMKNFLKRDVYNTSYEIFMGK